MIKLLLLPILVLLSCKLASAQNKAIKKFKGKLETELGKPVSDAYIINYRNYHGVTSKSDGSFGIYTQEGDSMVVSHISYKRQTIHATDTDSTFVLTIAPFEISPIIIQNRDIQMEYFKKNMKRMKLQLNRMLNPSWSDGKGDSYRNYRTTIRQFQHPNHR